MTRAPGLARLDPFRDLAPIAEAPPPSPPPASGPAGWYRRAFSLHELEGTPALQWFLGAMLLGFFVTFEEWIANPAIARATAEANRQVCWPFFPSCGDAYVLSLPPDGSSQLAVYMVLFALIAVCVLAMWRRRWLLAHAILLVLWLWKAVVFYVLTMELKGKYHVEHLWLCAIFLFVPHKLYFLRRGVVLFYFAISAIKIQDGWILGTFFRLDGLPLVPDAVRPLFTIAATLLELAAPLLLVRRRAVQRAVLAGYVLFHLFSGTVLETYSFPALSIAVLAILYGPGYEPTRPPLRAAAIPGWSALALFAAAQGLSFVIPGDARFTSEGTSFGSYVFFARRECQWEATILRTSGQTRTLSGQSSPKTSRCDPYIPLAALKRVCARDPRGIERVSWTFDLSVNGGPFHRVVDAPDACRQEYRLFARNSWIRTPDEGAPIVEPRAQAPEPGERMGRGRPPVAPQHRATSVDPGWAESALRPGLRALTIGLWIVWFAVLALQIASLIRSARGRRPT